MGTLNYTTTIDSGKTVGEMHALLAKHGAGAIATRYNAERRPAALSFNLDTPAGPQQTFTLPINVDGVEALLMKQARSRTIGRRYANRAQAERTAWRVAKAWLEAQLAIVEAGMVTLDQVMLPYLHVGPELTLYDAYRETGRLEITAGSGGHS